MSAVDGVGRNPTEWQYCEPVHTEPDSPKLTRRPPELDADSRLQMGVADTLVTNDSGSIASPRSGKRRKRFSIDNQMPWKTRSAWRIKKLGLDDEDVDKPPRGSSDIGSLSGSLGALRKCVKDWATHQLVEGAISAIIVVNAATIGLEQSFKLMDPQPEFALEVVNWLENVFLAIYIVELAANVFGRGREALQDNWVRFDFFLVTMGIAVTWIIEQESGDQAASQFGFVMVLRTLRLLRLVRTVRLLIRFKELWMLVHGLMNSASTMIYTLVLVMVILYIFSSVGIEVVTNNPTLMENEETAEILERYFSSLPQIMLTLLQFVCLDSIHIIYKPLIERDPSIALYFVPVILVVAVVLMNLVTAVIVSGAFEQARKDQELLQHIEGKKRERLVKDMRKMFKRLDADNSGKLSTDELRNINEEDRQVLSQATAISDPMEIFMALDVDEKGAVDLDEFCEGVWQVFVSQSPIELKRMEKQMNFLRRDVKELGRHQAHVTEHLKTIQRSLGNPSLSQEGGSGFMSSVTASQVSAFSARIQTLRSGQNQSPRLELEQLEGSFGSESRQSTPTKSRASKPPQVFDDSSEGDTKSDLDDALNLKDLECRRSGTFDASGATMAARAAKEKHFASLRKAMNDTLDELQWSVSVAKAHLEIAEDKLTRATFEAQHVITDSWDCIDTVSSLLAREHDDKFFTARDAQAKAKRSTLDMRGPPDIRSSPPPGSGWQSLSPRKQGTPGPAPLSKRPSRRKQDVGSSSDIKHRNGQPIVRVNL